MPSADLTVLPCAMTFEQMKTIAKEVLEDRLRDYPILGGAGGWDSTDPKEREQLIDGIAHDIAGRIAREAM